MTVSRPRTVLRPARAFKAFLFDGAGRHNEMPAPGQPTPGQRETAPKEPAMSMPAGTANLPHAVAEPGKPIEIHAARRRTGPRVVGRIRTNSETLTAAPHGNAAIQTAPASRSCRRRARKASGCCVSAGSTPTTVKTSSSRSARFPSIRSHTCTGRATRISTSSSQRPRLRVQEGRIRPGDFLRSRRRVNIDLGVEERLRFSDPWCLQHGTRSAPWAPQGQAEETRGREIARGGATASAPTDKARVPNFIPIPARAPGSRSSAWRTRRGSGTSRATCGATTDVGASISVSTTRRPRLTGDGRGHRNGHHDRSPRRRRLGVRSASLWGATTYRAIELHGFTEEDPNDPGVFPGRQREQGNTDSGLGGRVTYKTRRFKANDWLNGRISTSARRARAHSIAQVQDRHRRALQCDVGARRRRDDSRRRESTSSS